MMEAVCSGQRDAAMRGAAPAEDEANAGGSERATTGAEQWQGAQDLRRSRELLVFGWGFAEASMQHFA